MELEFVSNRASAPRREEMDGREFLVFPLSMIVPGVLPGSKGKLLYPEDEVVKNPIDWNGMPVTVGHPKDATGNSISGRTPDVEKKYTIGKVYNANANGNKLRGEAWVDVKRAERKLTKTEEGRKVWNRMNAGEAVELSTGLFTNNVPVAPGAKDHKGRSYDYVARDYKPDHLAILVGEKGACSVDDGCGVNVINAGINQPKSRNSGRFKSNNAGTGKGEAHEAAQRGFLNPNDDDRRVGSKVRRKRRPVEVADEATWKRAQDEASKGFALDSKDYWPNVVSIYRRLGGSFNPVANKELKASKEPFEPGQKKSSGGFFGRLRKLFSKNSGVTRNSLQSLLQGEPMKLTAKQRQETINFLTTNCSCWKEEGSKELLADFSDERLIGLKTATESALALNELVTDLGDEADEVTINEIPAFIKKKMDAKDEEDDAKNKAKNKAKNAKTKNAKTKNVDDEMLDTEDEEVETGNKTKNKKPTANEWLENMPDELKPVWNAATEIEATERKRLLGQLTTNTSKEFAGKYAKANLSDLRDLVANTSGKKDTNDEPTGNNGPLSIYPNANPAPTVNRSYDPNDKDMLALPKMDYSKSA